ncbi:nudix-type domain-containing protein 6 [Salpingoeca rosetta]|uniref:Nucleoside diphosphate-linked moiety X motif 6 n=1 Tax=Salpingoeca rosetta (strain ATCC 50818 / BSB-021) TaxID=946362 RepID=F2U0M1_SALR5|nr:nudix-type domain-containing protein 6 [Salpingoeca rosetta]EGD80949.1 nudix-type domain-containing protein 6 [Salpingoeca rosetta]|eukprot:XP_004997510.1 nudix-type domain-containing protein 6 [Salpingoeca rosetta]
MLMRRCCGALMRVRALTSKGGCVGLGGGVGVRRAASSLRDIAEAGRYNSVSIKLPQADWLTAQPNPDFKADLEQSLVQWQEQQKTAAWIVVPPSLSWAVYPATECGFQLHHVRDDHIYLMKWLEADTSCRVPPYATHQVGVAGLVLDKDMNVLVIKERNARVSGFKLPGGLSDPGEDIHTTAEREVLEETGVQCKFHSILSMRQQHKAAYGVSDLYIVCRCTPVTTDIEACPTEIAEARWMPIHDYAAQTTDMNARIARMVAAEAEQQPQPFHPATTLACDMTMRTLPSVVHKNRLFDLYLPAAAAKHEQ